MIREFSTIMRKRLKPSKRSKRRVRTKMKNHNFFNWRKRKKSRQSKLRTEELRVNGKLELRLSLIKSTLIPISNTTKLLLRQSLRRLKSCNSQKPMLQNRSPRQMLTEPPRLPMLISRPVLSLLKLSNLRERLKPSFKKDLPRRELTSKCWLRSKPSALLEQIRILLSTETKGAIS